MSGSLSFLQNLSQLKELRLEGQVSGGLSLLGNNTQLNDLGLGSSQVNGDITSLPKLFQLRYLDVEDTNVGVPTQQQLATNSSSSTLIAAFTMALDT